LPYNICVRDVYHAKTSITTVNINKTLTDGFDQVNLKSTLLPFLVWDVRPVDAIICVVASIMVVKARVKAKANAKVRINVTVVHGIDLITNGKYILWMYLV
jgi:hypothetical protein